MDESPPVVLHINAMRQENQLMRIDDPFLMGVSTSQSTETYLMSQSTYVTFKIRFLTSLSPLHVTPYRPAAPHVLTSLSLPFALLPLHMVVVWSCWVEPTMG